MGFLKALFGGQEETPEEKKQKENERKFDTLKYDGIRARRIGEYGHAVRCFQEALNIRHDDEIMEYLAEGLLICRQSNEGYATYEQLATLHPTEIKYPIALARLDEIRMNYQLMEKHCEQALAIDEKNATALYLSARTKYRQKDDLSAIILLTKAITQNKIYTEAYLLRCELLEQMGCIKEAEETLDDILNSEQPSEEILMKKAQLCMKNKKFEEAIIYYNKVKETNPMIKSAYIGLSTAYSLTHQLDKALSTMNDVLDFMSDFAEGFKERGRIKLLLNDKEGAADDLKQALSINPKVIDGLEGKFTNIEQEMNEQYKNRNPYGF